MNRAAKLIALVAALAAAPALGHERADRALGVVEKVDAQQIVLKGRDGHPVTFALTPDTRFLRGGKPAKAGDVKVGERAVVHGRKAGERVEALEVKLGGGATKTK
jgi:hypothetical protein